MKTMKRCGSCKEAKHSYEFRKDATRKDGLSNYCGVCQSRYQRSWWAARSREQAVDFNRRAHLKSKYRLTVEQWDAILVSQGGGCALCPAMTPGTVKGWQTDHDHKTGRVRGILCLKCNSAIGHYEKLRDGVGLAAVEGYLL